MWSQTDSRSPQAPEPGAKPEKSPAAQPSGARPAVRSESGGVISKSLRIEGAVTGAADLYVEGEIIGSVELSDNALTVGPGGSVDAEVKARSVTVLGRLNGNVHAKDRIEITKTGTLEGEITTSRIAVEDGAVFRGSVNIAKPEIVAGKPADSVNSEEPSAKTAAAGAASSSPQTRKQA